MAQTKLTPRQLKFAQVYDGNATDAARKAGYTGSDAVLATQGQRLLRNAEVAALIRAREQKTVGKHIATREERQAFWSSMMNNEDEHPMARLKASELLGRSNADFVERVQHSGSLTLEQLVLGASQSSPTALTPPSNERGGSVSAGSEPARSSAEASEPQPLPYTLPEGADHGPALHDAQPERAGEGEGHENP